MGVSVKDMLTTRTRLAFLNSQAALEVAPKVADLMGTTLGWSKREKTRQLSDAMKYLSSFGGPLSTEIDEMMDVMRTEMDVKSIFDMFDQDQNGYIDFQEMKTTANKMGYRFKSDEDALATFRKLDANGNGRINFEEFENWWHDASGQDKLRQKLGEKIGMN